MKLLRKGLEQMISGKIILPEIIKQRKIYYPGYFNCEFGSLPEAVRHIKKNGSSLKYYIPDIIMYNICYRDYLRMHGIDMLIKRLEIDAPELKNEPQLSQNLQNWYKREGQMVSGYDIQCYNIKDTITILGHEFHGLEDVMAHRTAYGRIGYSDLSICIPKSRKSGLYVSEFYARYPIFDSYDIGDDRTYQNYIFTNEPINEETLKEIAEIRHNNNYCMVHEDIPEHLLPILYYSGDGDYMILAQKK